MKRLVYILFVIILLSPFAFARMYLPILFRSGGVVCDDCSGSLQFAWHMEDNDSTPDVTVGDPCGCSDGDTVGAQTGSPVFSTTQKSDGTYSLRIDAAGEYYLFVPSSEDIGSLDDIKITFDIYIASYPTAEAVGVIRLINTSNIDLIDISLSLDDTVDVYRVINDGAQEEFVSVAVATGGFVSCEYQAKTGVAGNDHYLICGASTDEKDNDLAAASDTEFVYYGDYIGLDAGDYYLDNVKITPSDRY